MIVVLLFSVAIYVGLRYVVFRSLLALPPLLEKPHVALIKLAMNLLLGAVIAAVLLALTLAPGLVLGYFAVTQGAPDAASAGDLQNVYEMLAVAAMQEEFIYRGIVLLLLVIAQGYILLALAGADAVRSQRAKAVLFLNAAVLSSIIFSYVHAANPSAVPIALVNIFLVGLLLSLMLLVTRGLGMAIGFHFAWNALLELFNLPVSGWEFSTRWHPLNIAATGAPAVTGGDFGPEASVVLTALLLAANAIWVRVYFTKLDTSALPIKTDAIGDESISDFSPSQDDR